VGGPSVRGRGEALVEEWLYRHARHNQYFHVNPYPNVRQDERGILVKARKTDISRVEFLHVDIDPTPPPPDASASEKVAHLSNERERILARLTELGPSFLIDSGGGYQALLRPDRRSVRQGQPQGC
jgi:nucleotidyltransferase/DNA polymerase involved in DNA repair